MKKRFIIDIGHPAQVHNFKYVYRELVDRGWQGFFTLKDKEVAKKLLDHYEIPYRELRRNYKGKLVNMIVALLNTIQFTFICLRYKPGIIISRNSIHSSLTGKLLRINHIALSDTESALNLSKYVDAVVTGESYKLDLGDNHIHGKLNIELFYLHPKRFKLDKDIYRLLNLKPGEKFTLIRFVSWQAHHDTGLEGMSLENKIKSVKAFEKFGKVLISSEKQLPAELEKYKISVPPERMHDVLAVASLMYGESSTMASEAAMLGTPAIFLDDVGRGYTDEEEDYGLVFNFTSTPEYQEKAIRKGVELLQIDSSVIRKRRDVFLEDKIDATGFLAWFIEDFPESLRIMKENPDYQERFR